MEVSANWVFILIIIPISGILVGAWDLTKKKIYIWLLVMLWGVVGIIYLFSRRSFLQEEKLVNFPIEKKHYYGSYVIAREFFSGDQVDWQYDHFRFEIKDNDSIYFHQTNGATVNKTYRGKISTIKLDTNENLVLQMDAQTHHILKTNPRLYLKDNELFLVFKSKKYHNVYFKKGEWKEIE
ncbi:hypothetical protein [Flectobacillus longus]|uniref:hypothetical protein n=1 Tax=Flectobacillus longus TaxID=2984207 RepID=UPI0024B7F40E|nr:hypothetical protein [Flectobacillus longus]MDI9879462.1 hypothetical protein [Flectobacillus longus]